MKKNMGAMDKLVRLVLAAIFALLFFTNTVTGALGVVLIIIAGIFVATSSVSYCPIYRIVGINTCSVKKA